MVKRFWLMKAEPDSRIVKGKDVKFSVDDFESVKTSPWEGVRNHEAKKLMQQMKLGDEIAFYHSNCKTPGIAGFAEVEKEAYPDYTSWDPDHPYFDPKTDKESPKWFMVDVTFKSRAKNFVSLALMKRIAAFPTSESFEDLAYIGNDGVEAIKNMALIKRGRLSVQPVEEDAWTAIHLLADNGGWEENEKKSKKGKAEAPKTTSRKRKKEKKPDSELDSASNNAEEEEEIDDEERKPKEEERGRVIEAEGTTEPSGSVAKRSTKAKAKRRKIDDETEEGVKSTRRRSARIRK